MSQIYYNYKVGIKEEIINALRLVFDKDTYPDKTYAGKVYIGSEYPNTEIQYPMIIIRYQPSLLKNIGIAHYELDVDNPLQKLLHWRFQGSLQFQVNALTPLDRDSIIDGLLTILAFGPEIPSFQNFRYQVMDQTFVTMTLITDDIQESGDSNYNPSWDTNNEMVYVDTLSIQIFGEFFTNPATGDLVEIDQVSIYPTIDTSLI